MSILTRAGSHSSNSYLNLNRCFIASVKFTIENGSIELYLYVVYVLDWPSLPSTVILRTDHKIERCAAFAHLSGNGCRTAVIVTTRVAVVTKSKCVLVCV